MGDYQRAKEYHARNVSREDVKQKVTKSILEEVIATNKWHFHVNGEKIKICKTFYLQTLGIRDNTVRKALETVTH